MLGLGEHAAVPGSVSRQGRERPVSPVDVQLTGAQGVLGQGLAVLGHGAGVAAGHRAGQRRLPHRQRIVQGGPRQGSEHALRLLESQLAQQLQGLAGDRGEVVGAVGQGRVVDRAVGLGDDHGLTAHLHDQRLRDRQHRRRGGDTERAAAEPRQVQTQPGERHGRVDRQPDGSGLPRRLQDLHAPAAGGVGHELPGLPVPGRGQSAHQVGQLIVGNGQQHELRALHDLLRGEDRDLGQQQLGTLPGGLRDGGDPHHPVPGGTQRGSQHRPHSPGADHADSQAPGAVGGFAHGLLLCALGSAGLWADARCGGPDGSCDGAAATFRRSATTL